MSCCAKSIDGKRTFEEISVGSEGIEFEGSSNPPTKIARNSSTGELEFTVDNASALKLSTAGLEVDSISTNNAGLITIHDTIEVDTITENTFNVGVTIEGVLLNNNDVTATEVFVNDIHEKTPGADIRINDDVDMVVSTLKCSNGTSSVPSLVGRGITDTGLFWTPTIGMGVSVLGTIHSYFQNNSFSTSGLIDCDDGTASATDTTTRYGFDALGTQLELDVAGTTVATVTSTGLTIDDIKESTTAAGVTVEGVLLKDTDVTCDLLTTTVGVDLPNGLSTLDYYDTQSVNIDFSGPWATNRTSTWTLVRVGEMVTITMTVDPSSTASSAVAAQSTTGLPADYRPAKAVYGFMNVTDNGTIKSGSLRINITGIIDVWAGAPGTAFAGAGATSFNGGTISYAV